MKWYLKFIELASWRKACINIDNKRKNQVSRSSKMRVELKGIKFSRARLPGAVELLDFLKGKGYILVVISNNDGKTEEKCEEVGIREYFDIIIDSTNIGLIKPDARIFQFVLEKLKLSNSQAIHIGDLYGSDVMGGLNAGIDVIWLNNRRIQKLNGSQVIEYENLSEIKKLFK